MTTCGLAESFEQPLCRAPSAHRAQILNGFRSIVQLDTWIEVFATAARRAADLANAYLDAVFELQQRWRTMLASGPDPRSDAAAWAVLDTLPAHPVITSPAAGAATGRAKAAVHNALEQLETAGVLLRLAGGRRNRSWEAIGPLDLHRRPRGRRPPAPAS